MITVTARGVVPFARRKVVGLRAESIEGSGVTAKFFSRPGW